jgi:hypothetical protein
MKKVILHIHPLEWYFIPVEQFVLYETGGRKFTFLCFTIQIV